MSISGSLIIGIMAVVLTVGATSKHGIEGIHGSALLILNGALLIILSRITK